MSYLSLEAPRDGVAGYAHVTEIISGLQKRGWTVELYSPGHDWKRPSLISRLLDQIVLQLKLIKNLSRGQTVYIRAHPLALLACLIADQYGCNVVHEVNGTWEDIFVVYPKLLKIRKLIVFMQRKQFEKARGLICVTPQLQNWLTKVVKTKLPAIKIVPNGANTLLFAPGPVSKRVLPKSYVVFFGGLTIWHGIETMLSALRSKDWPDGIALVVVGDGPEKEKLDKFAKSDERLILLGRLSYKEVPEIVRGALAGLVPISDPNNRSSISGLAPLKLFETLSCGIPAIVTDLPFQADFVRDNDCGLVIPVNDGNAMAVAISELVNNLEAAKSMGEKGRKVIISNHSWDSRASDTDNFLRSLIV